MYSKREIVIFCAGMQVFHTISHVLIGMAHTLPIQFLSITWTQPLNIIAIVINTIASIGLLWLASKLPK